MVQIILIIVLVVLAIWLLRKVFPAQAISPSSSNHNAYEAVSIHPYKDRCTDAQQVAGQRFLSSEAPPLPLENCTSEKCHCVYMHHSDRRSGTDRRANHNSSEEFLTARGSQNRRSSHGRRASDLAIA